MVCYHQNPIRRTLGLTLIGPQALPTLLKAIACRKDAYPSLIVHSPKCPRANTRGVDGRGQPSDLPTKSFECIIMFELKSFYEKDYTLYLLFEILIENV